MHFLFDNLAVLTVAIVVSMLAWLWGGLRYEPLEATVPWMLLFMVEIGICFPQRRHGESTFDCRERVWEAMKKDPLVLLSLALIIILAIPFVNNGLCPGCDQALIAQGLPADPPFKFLPFCVNRAQHYNVFLWFAVAIVSMIMTKHCLADHGKRMLLRMIVWNGFALAMFGFIEIATTAPGPFWQPLITHWGTQGMFFSTFGYVNVAGDYFVTIFALSVACWRDSVETMRLKVAEDPTAEDKRHHLVFWQKHVYLVPAAISFFAAINTLSRAAIILVGALSLVYFLHAFCSFTKRMKRAERVRKGTYTLACVLLVGFFAAQSIPTNVMKEVDTLSTNAVLDRTSGKGSYANRIASDLWFDNFLFGCGGWGYVHFSPLKMTPEELKHMHVFGGANVHNDYLQFLAEHGTVGFGLIVAIVFLLLKPICRQWRQLAKNARFVKGHDQPARPVSVFALPAPTFIVLTSALATFAHGFADCPFRSSAVSTLFLVSLAAAYGYLGIGDVDEPEHRSEHRHHSEHHHNSEHHHHHHHHQENEAGDKPEENNAAR